MRITLGWDNSRRREQVEIETPQPPPADDSRTVIRPNYQWSDAVAQLPSAVPPPYGPGPAS